MPDATRAEHAKEPPGRFDERAPSVRLNFDLAAQLVLHARLLQLILKENLKVRFQIASSSPVILWNRAGRAP